MDDGDVCLSSYDSAAQRLVSHRFRTVGGRLERESIPSCYLWAVRARCHGARRWSSPGGAVGWLAARAVRLDEGRPPRCAVSAREVDSTRTDGQGSPLTREVPPVAGNQDLDNPDSS